MNPPENPEATTTAGTVRTAEGPVASAAPTAVAHTTSYPGGYWEPGAPEYGTASPVAAKLTMDDGVTLGATVTYPTNLTTGQRATGPFPVVLEHTPYEQTGTNHDYFVGHGYISLLVHARGTWDSGGDFDLWGPRDARDGVVIVNWAAHQLGGSDGRVVMVGCSYPGQMALNDAAAVGPDSPLKAVVAAGSGPGAAERETWMNSGILTQGFSFATNPESNYGDTPAATSFFDHLTTQMKNGEDPAYAGGEFWSKRLPLQAAQDIVHNKIPVLLWSGWEDILLTGAVRAAAAFQNAANRRPVGAAMNPHQRTDPRYQIVVGNWKHCDGLDNGIVLQWLETWLNHADTGLQKADAPFHLYEVGTGRWVNVHQYPVVSRYTSWYIDGKSGLSSNPAAPSAGGGQSLVWGRQPNEPGGELSYTTPAFADGATLAGPISATVYASSSNSNLQLIASLYDVAPDGSRVRIMAGAMLGSQRELDDRASWKDQGGTVVWPHQSQEEDNYLRPGKVYQFDVALRPILWAVLAGHRLELGLTTQTPGIQPLDRLTFGTDACFLTAPAQATVPGGTYTIMHGPQFKTAVNLPLLPAGALPTAASGATPTSAGIVQPQDWSIGN